MLNLRSVLPTRSGEGADIKPTHDELVARVNLLATRVDALERDNVKLKAIVVKLSTGALAAPRTRDLADCDSARKIMAYIGAEVYGKSDDTAHLPVRAALLTHKAFQQARNKMAAEGAVITAEIPFLRALATREKDGRLVFARVVDVAPTDFAKEVGA